MHHVMVILSSRAHSERVRVFQRVPFPREKMHLSQSLGKDSADFRPIRGPVPISLSNARG